MADISHGEGRGDDNEDEDDDEIIDETGYKTVKDAVLFAIDVSQSMLLKHETTDGKSSKATTDTATSAALRCAYALMQQRIISHPNDMMGILLFGTAETKFTEDKENAGSTLSYPHCYLLADLDVPAAADVKTLRAMIEDEEESQTILIPSKERVPMSNVLFCANQIFTTKAPNFSSRRLFLVTDNDNPHGTDSTLRSAATVRAKDLYDLGVHIELFPISQPGHEFDRTKFYDDIVYRSLLTDPDAPAPLIAAAKSASAADGRTLLNSLLSSINSRAAPRRALFSNLPFEIGPNLRISVKGYIIIKRQVPARSCYVWLNGEKPQIALGKSAPLSDELARPVDATEVRKAYSFGGERVSFTKEEYTALRQFGDPVLRIIGFKPLSLLPPWANVRPSTFIYPSEDEYTGSTRVFSALYQKLLESSKFGLAWYIPRRNATPTLAAIIAGSERISDEGEQTFPPGLWVRPLPFADDIRLNPDTIHVVSPDALTDAMRTVMQQLQLPQAVYDPARYPNPALQWHYRILQALALEEDLPEKPDDKTVPRYRQIHKRVGPYVLEWGKVLEEEFAKWSRENGGGGAGSWGGVVAGRKRGRAGDEGSTASKKSKDGDGESGLTDVQVKRAFEQNRISKFNVAELKGWLKMHNLAISGKKDELVERVEGWCEQK